MVLYVRSQPSETQRKRSLKQRMKLVHMALCFVLLIIVARLMELQLIRGSEFHAFAQSQHYGGVVLPAKRGEVLAVNSKTGETSIMATNTTLDMVYVDPLITNDPTYVAETLADVLITDAVHQHCLAGQSDCPRKLVKYYQAAFDPLDRLENFSGSLLEPLPVGRPTIDQDRLPDITEARRLFARDIEEDISEKRVRFVPLVYGANKSQLEEVRQLGIRGVTALEESRLIYADPEQIDQVSLGSIARKLSEPVQMDPSTLRHILRSRPLRYAAVMHRLAPDTSAKIRELKLESLRNTAEKRSQVSQDMVSEIQDPLRGIALIPEHWRYYPDGQVGAHVIGFLNSNQEAQYGVERTYNAQLRGQEGRISTVSDPQGGQIVTGEQTIVDPKDGDTIVLTIDRFIQKEVETIINNAVEEYGAESGQAIVMDPKTGRVLAMVNAPLFDGNHFSDVYKKKPIVLDEGKQKEVVVEIYHPQTNAFVLKAYYNDVFTGSGRVVLSEEKREELGEIEQLYDLKDIARYYLYIGENHRHELFPTDRPDIWLKYENRLGVGVYLNRTVQEIYEPGSVLKAVTMAIALDQGEIVPSDTYDDFEPVELQDYTIRNALNIHYGRVTMTQCLEDSVNTCLTSISKKLGSKLFYRMLTRFGFGSVTGIELEDELPGRIQHWKVRWSDALLATASYGQGISGTPLQVVTAFSALANGGKLMRPTIVDSIVHSDGTVEKNKPHMVDQVIKPETSDTITAMLVSTVTNGQAHRAKPAGYRVAGKTGTSQIARPGGGYETGTGSSITSFAGYGPVDDPQFVVLVKLDRPKYVDFGSQSAAPVFQKIASFLFRYYGIPPDDAY